MICKRKYKESMWEKHVYDTMKIWKHIVHIPYLLLLHKTFFVSEISENPKYIKMRYN